MHSSLLTAALLLRAVPALAEDPSGTPTPPPAESSAPAPAEAAPPADQPAPAPAEPAAVKAPMDPAAAYQAGKLTRKLLKDTDDYYVPTLRAVPDKSLAPWAVYRGDGSVVPASELAILIEDKPLVTKMEKAQKRSKVLRWSLTGTGVALVGLAVVPLLGMEDVGDLGKEPLAENYPSAEEYTNALTDWRQQREDTNQNQNRLLSSVTLGATGALCIAVSPFATVGVRERQKIAPVYYQADALDEKILKYNVGLKKKLGLTAPDPTEVVIQPPPQAQPQDVEDDEDIDIPEPSGGGSAPPLDLEGAPYLELSPVLGFGYLGLQGTF